VYSQPFPIEIPQVVVHNVPMKVKLGVYVSVINVKLMFMLVSSVEESESSQDLTTADPQVIYL